jgi:signal transduction histidine kinase
MSYSHPISVAVSSEFISLCQTQIALLTQGLGAGWSAVYLTQTWGENSTAKLIPIVVYPQTSNIWQQDLEGMGLPKGLIPNSLSPRLLSASSEFLDQEIKPTETSTAEWEEASFSEHQIVLPLMDEERVLGLLVTGRKDRHWREKELAQIEKIARTLALARVIDQRQEWQQQQLKEQQYLQTIQRDRLDNLLHQLRNPLTALRTFSKLLLKRLLPDDRNQSVAQGLVRESDRLQELLQQLEQEIGKIAPENVLISAEETQLSLPPASPFLLGGESLPLETININNILEPLLLSAAAIAQERQLELITVIPNNLASVQGHGKALREVFSNLIDNALKYTPQGGQIKVQTGITQSFANIPYQGIAISDTGYGIPAEDQVHIFERHFRGIQAEGEIFGTGLGLAIVKELVEQMQGKIEFISPNPSLKSANFPGTLFLVWLLLK